VRTHSRFNLGRGSTRATATLCGLALASLIAAPFAHAAGAVDTRSASAVVPKPPGTNCTISAAAAVATSEAALVDVRQNADKSPVWIPGAVRLPPAFVPAFASGITSNFLWIGSGSDDAALENACHDLPPALRARVRVVSGGIRAWYRAKGKVMGATPVLERVLLLEPLELDALLRQPNARIVEVGAARLGAAVESSRRSHVDAKSAPEQAFAKAAKSGSDVTVFIVRDAELAAKWWRASPHGAGREPLFFVEDGDRFAAYARQRNAIAANANKPLTQSCDQK
jgi:rhodanese-related sulfurtransferase